MNKTFQYPYSGKPEPKFIFLTKGKEGWSKDYMKVTNKFYPLCTNSGQKKKYIYIVENISWNAIKQMEDIFPFPLVLDFRVETRLFWRRILLCFKCRKRREVQSYLGFGWLPYSLYDTLFASFQEFIAIGFGKHGHPSKIS